MKVIGYSDELSVFPGDPVRFFVSCDADRYRADVVKLIHGDTNPDGPGFKIEPVSTDVDGELRVASSASTRARTCWSTITRACASGTSSPCRS